MVENLVEVNGDLSQPLTGQAQSTPARRSRPRPRPTFKTRNQAQNQSEAEESQTELSRNSEALSTPPRETNGRSQSEASDSRLTSPEVSGSAPNGSPTKKRARSTMETDEDEGDRPAQPETQLDEVIVHRKRVRR